MEIWPAETASTRWSRRMPVSLSPSARARAGARARRARAGWRLVEKMASVGRVQFFLARTRHTHETHRVYGEWTSE